jgi:quinol monooxygenase YgiN
MIMSTARDYIIPEKVNEYLKLINELIKETLKEDGNISYTLFKDRNNEGEFVLLEYWKDQESLDAHFKTAHFTSLVPQIAKLQKKASVVNSYEEVKW